MFNQTQLYYDRMLSSLGDKVRVVEHLVGNKVIDMGFGDASLISHLNNRNYDVYGIDAASSSLTQAHEKHPDLQGRLFQSYAHEGNKFFAPETIDSIISSSLLHEVYSYGLPGKAPLSLEAVEDTIRSWRNLLSPDGVLIIRDGIIPANWDTLTTVKFKESSRYDQGRDMVDEYLERIPFLSSSNNKEKGKVFLERHHDGSISGTHESIMEFLYTYTWGIDSYERETQEKYGVFSLSDYQAFLVKCGFRITHAEEYVQSGYENSLREKVKIFQNGASTSFPPTNALIVAVKN